MAGESVWIVTWLPLPTSVVGHKRKALSPEHREFDDLTNAVRESARKLERPYVP
jgi:hypothetical protein